MSSERRILRRSAVAVRVGNLNPWSDVTSVKSMLRSETLQERLEELLVLEIRQDGGRDFLQLSVRGLYKRVMSAITQTREIRASSGTLRRSSIVDSRRTLPSSVRISGGGGGAGGSVGFDNNSSTILEDHSSSAELPPSSPLSSQRARADSALLSSSRNVPVGVQDAGATGGGGNKKEGHVTYRERLGAFLHPRDMRRLITPFSTSNEPELIVRRHVMLLNFDPLRAIILRDRLLVLVPDGADSVLGTLETRVRAGGSAYERSLFGSTATQVASVAAAAKTAGANNNNGAAAAANKKTGKEKSSGIGKIIARASSAISSRVGGSSGNLVALEKEQQQQEKQPDNTGGEDNNDHETTSSSSSSESRHDEWDEMEGRDWMDLPFELQCTDSVLHTVCGILIEDTSELQETVSEYITLLVQDPGALKDDPLFILRTVKDSVREMSARVSGFLKSLNRTLDEDEDMALMNLSRLLTHPERFIQPVPPEVLEEESDEPELILEAHLQTALTLTNSLDLIQGQIDSASALVTQRLDEARNKLLLANTVITTMSLCVACGSFIGSIFGMNLVNGSEDSHQVFMLVTILTSFGIIALCAVILSYLSYTGTISLAVCRG